MLNHIQKNMMLWMLIVVVSSSLFLFIQEITKNQKPKVIFLDVGQGDSIFITTASGRQVLVDAGKYSNITQKISNYMSVSDRSIDVLIATHPDIDHVAGFETILDEYSIDLFLHSGLLAGAPVYRTIAKKVRENNISAHAVVAGDKIKIDTDMYLEVLSPYTGQKIDEPNDHSVVVRVVYKDKAILLTGDASKITEQNLVSMYGERLESEVLKLGHHGSKTSTDNHFVKTVNPQYGIISASCDNSFGHPHASVLRTLDENEVTELNTCEKEDIVFEFNDGNWVLNE